MQATNCIAFIVLTEYKQSDFNKTQQCEGLPPLRQSMHEATNIQKKKFTVLKAPPHINITQYFF